MSQSGNANKLWMGNLGGEKLRAAAMAVSGKMGR